MPTVRATHARRWKRAVIALRGFVLGEDHLLSGFRPAAELAMKDDEFLLWWRRLAERYDECVRTRALAFLDGLEKRTEVWSFEREFRRHFN